ncbi:hypothetical protein C8R46DRAFT_1300387 [Mycena filopes]|nr:hypothetical protein C8R46DRAFT_1300387 [Mycena filopes]
MPDYRENQRIALLYAQNMDRPRRDAVDYGVPPVPHMPRPTQTNRPPNPRATPLRIALPDLSPDAPSKSPKHPYAMLFLDNLRSGATSVDPPLPAQCPECIADRFVERTRKQVPHAPRIEPDTEFKGPALGAPVYVNFCQPANATSGILVVDILGFNANMIQPEYLLVRHGMGPIKVTLRIEGYDTVDDILYANCAHRSITRFNLAWWLAIALARFAKDKYQLSAEGLRLRGVYSPDGVTWTALARYGI